MGLPIKLLFLSEEVDSAWNSPCEETRLEWWILFGVYLSVCLISLLLPSIAPTETSLVMDENTNTDSDTEPLLPNVSF